MLFLGERYLYESGCAVAPRHRHLAQTALERAAPVLDHLTDELLVGVDSLLEDHALNGFPDHVAARETCLLVERPVHGGAGSLEAREYVVVPELVVRADLLGRKVDAVLEPRDRADRD